MGKRKKTPVKDGFKIATEGGVLRKGAGILDGGVIAKGHSDVMNVDLANLGGKKGKKSELDFGF